MKKAPLTNLKSGTNNIKEIFNTFMLNIERELKRYSYFKFSEELFRFYFYKTLIESNYNDNEIEYEANFQEKKKGDGQNDKVDIKFDDSFLELKYHRRLQNGNIRPKPYGLGKVLADFFKLTNAPNNVNKTYLLYVFDDSYLSYIKNNNFGFLLSDKNSFSLSEIRENYNPTVNKQLKDYPKGNVNFKLLFKQQIGFTNGNLNFYFYKI